jgi:hypothetical protein
MRGGEEHPRMRPEVMRKAQFQLPMLLRLGDGIPLHRRAGQPGADAVG